MTTKKHPGFLAMPSKKQMIQELIEGQKEFMSEINEHGHSEKDYWINKEEYRRTQENLAKGIHNDAHKQYLHEYQSASVKADINAPGGWLAKDETNKKETE